MWGFEHLFNRHNCLYVMKTERKVNLNKALYWFNVFFRAQEQLEKGVQETSNLQKELDQIRKENKTLQNDLQKEQQEAASLKVCWKIMNSLRHGELHKYWTLMFDMVWFISTGAEWSERERNESTGQTNGSNQGRKGQLTEHLTAAGERNGQRKGLYFRRVKSVLHLRCED